MTINTFTVGADPELFIINKKSGKVVSSIGLIPGEKGKPYVSEDMPSGFGLETDNILAEFNIPPVTNKVSFVNNIEYMKNYISRYVQEKNPDLGILCKASMNVPEDQLNSPEAKLFGCDPDYNVYTQSVNKKPNGENTNLRSAGFHIHICYPRFNTQTSLTLVKYLDMFLGIPSVIWDNDCKRRTLYGKAGSFRLTSYGLEYRTLSSALMKDAESLDKVWNGIIKAIHYNNMCGPTINSRLVIEAIDNNNVDLANKLISEYNLI